MSNLDQYNKKRDFSQTAEPQAKKEKIKSAGQHFVVQRHHASRLHYDFRLEIDGALKSWAVPKGPSLNPKDKRLAVQVEDHPISYGSFEGHIPKGNYGAGTVSIFDEGTYIPLEVKSEKDFLQQWKNGNIKFTLKGKILKGDFALVRMNGADSDNWLLIKHKDEFSSDKPFDAEMLVSDSVKAEGKDFKKKTAKANTETVKKKSQSIDDKQLKPMLAKLSQSLPDSHDWLFEKKFDGFRSLYYALDSTKKLISRNGNLLNKKFPSILKDLENLSRACVLDGEIVIENKQGISQFQYLQSGEPIQNNLQLYYYVFDILYLDDVDLKSYALTERKEILRLLFSKHKFQHIILVEEIIPEDQDLLAHAREQKWEGIISKLKDSTYDMGLRSEKWLKIKIRNTQEAIICGFTKPEGSRSYFGALVLGIKSGGQFKYIGNCGTGFNEEMLKSLSALFKPLQTQTKPFPKSEKIAKEKDVTWLRPQLVCDVYFSEWTLDEHLRHPVFKGIRDDKSADETTKEEPANEVSGKENRVMDKELKFGKKTVKLTNLDKLYWPTEKISKGDLLDYYEKMADYILPYLKDKPISMNRFPNGIDKQSFFQKDVDPDKIPAWLKTTEVFSESTSKTIDYLLCNDLPSLLYIVNLGSIEINPWLSTYKKPEKPQYAVLDLDPNGAEWEDIIDVALSCKEVLDRGNIPGFIKTSGSSGLHIFMNVAGKYDYQVVRDFVQFIAELVHQMHPETTSLVRDPQKRKGLIYLDYLQNKEGQTIVAPYSVRPKPNATVSTPVLWEEVNYDLSIQDFHIFNVYGRASSIEDPWKDLNSSKVDIKKTLSNF